MDEKKRIFPSLEEEILKYWEDHDIFQKTLDKPSANGEFVFFEGPPTANGKPGIHHLEARAFKDVIPRYRTMRGYHVRRKGGWDTHGLPVELEVEKQLGLKSKKEIEKYGIAEFNAKCKESVWKYLEDWNAFTRRIGFWVDQKDPYVTYDPKYVESLWAVVKHIWDCGLLYKDYKVVPWCPRCGTGLSSHELAQGYQDVKDLSVTAEFRVKDPSVHGLPERTSILAWTTTPWTLPGNVGLAVGAEIVYVVIEKQDEGSGPLVHFVVATELVEKIFVGQEYKVVIEKKGAELVGIEYEPLYPFMQNLVTGEEKTKLDEKAYRVYAADFVTTEEGTGIVHTAVMYGQDDFELGTKVGLPKHHLVNLDGTFVEGTDFLAGRFVKDDALAVDIVKDLANRGLLFSKAKYEHSYPHCWRCKTPVIYYARDSWYIRMSELREELISENQTINWEPAHIKNGRFGEWLDGIKDWAISRERYWGTPLPIWECQSCNERTCVGSFEELGLKGDFDPHRPYVDDIELKCKKCGGVSKRVKEVMDVWFDSGAMPFAQDHYPFENKKWVEGVGYPADYISEAIDQTRGWFYTLHAIGILMGRGKAFKNVICLGHLMDANGKKMSKSVGNVVDPWAMIDKYGVDALRWWMYSVNQPGESKNFDEKTVDEIVKRVFMILWNVKAFYEMYVSAVPHSVRTFGLTPSESQHVLDRWIIARLNELIEQATKDMDAFRVLEPARAIGEFITDLSQWYVRRSRDRFKQGDKDAMTTLGVVLMTLSKLMAPFTPFIAERIYHDLGGPLESVHLEEWPEIVKGIEGIEGVKVIEEMKTVRGIVSLVLEKRATAKIPVRQALASATVMMGGKLSNELKAIIADEVNVKEVKVVKGIEGVEGIEVVLDTTLTPELIEEGMAREIIRRVNDLRKAKGLTIGDTIRLTIGTKSDILRRSVETYIEEIKKGTIASGLVLTDELAGEPQDIQGELLTLSV